MVRPERATSETVAAWTPIMAASGYGLGGVLGGGMEGVVVEVSDDLVAKLWHDRPAVELQRLQRFYQALDEAGAAITTPRILEVIVHEGRCATIDRRVHGTPLRAVEHKPQPTVEAVDALLDVLGALASIEPNDDLRCLPMMPGEPPFDSRPFAESMGQLVRRRATTGPLAAALPDLATIVDAVEDRLTKLPYGKPGLLHGDLIPANVLVAGERLAVIDFGFLSTIGDPAFDAAVTASIFDMYGPDARRIEADLDAATAERFGYDEQSRWVHRAAYALATATAYSPSGADGHFTWCVEMLRRPEVRGALFD